MKKIILIVMVIIAMIKFSYSHPPDEITAEFDTTNKILQITVSHSVRDVQKHYINKLVIELNGVQIIEQRSNLQIDNKIQRYIYTMPEATIEDKISIEAYCNISGKKKITRQIKQLLKYPEE